MSVKWIEAVWQEVDGPEDLGEIVDEGDWTDERKYQHKTDIVHVTDPSIGQHLDIPFEKGYYCINQSRSGSYWSDYEYDEPTITKVEPYDEVITVTKWRKV